MGYTHYWTRPVSIGRSHFNAASRDCHRVCNVLAIPLAGADGTGVPTFDHAAIVFNGHVATGQRLPDIACATQVGHWPHEVAFGILFPNHPGIEAAARTPPLILGRMLRSDGSGAEAPFRFTRTVDPTSEDPCFGACQTRFRPYDLAVQCCLIAIKEHVPGVCVKSDGSQRLWNEAADLCQHTLGYGLLFALDTHLPLPPYLDGVA